MNDVLHNVAQVVIWVAVTAGILVIAIALVRTTIYYILHAGWNGGVDFGEHIRLDLGRSLTLCLEYFLAADVLQTAVAPSWEEIGQLAAIATIRTGLNFFLQREVEITRNVTDKPEHRNFKPGEGTGKSDVE